MDIKKIQLSLAEAAELAEKKLLQVSGLVSAFPAASSEAGEEKCFWFFIPGIFYDLFLKGKSNSQELD
jgi:hypothetical protein